MSEPDYLLGKQGFKKKSFYKLLNFLGHSFVRLVLFFLFSNKKVNREVSKFDQGYTGCI